MLETTLTNLQHQALKILVQDTSAGSPITGMNLSKRLGLKKRTGEENSGLRQIIHVLRIKGFPICATGRGYFYAQTSEQLSKFIVKLQERVVSQEQALNALKNAFDKVGSLGVMKSSGEPVQKEIYVKTPDGLAKKIKVEIDSKGNPVIPANTQVL